MQVYLDKSCYTEYTINQHIIKLYHTTQNSGSTPPISTILIEFQLIKPIKRLTCKLPCESYPKIVHSLNMKKGRSDTPLS